MTIRLPAAFIKDKYNFDFLVESYDDYTSMRRYIYENRHPDRIKPYTKHNAGVLTIVVQMAQRRMMQAVIDAMNDFNIGIAEMVKLIDDNISTK